MASVSVVWAATRACSEPRWTRAHLSRSVRAIVGGAVPEARDLETTEPVTSERTPPLVTRERGAEVASGSHDRVSCDPTRKAKKVGRVCKAVSF